MTLKQTPLHARHKAQGARLLEFGGFDMPLQYTGILEEHRAVRNQAGVFDVSHMGEIIIRGAQALEFVQFLITNDASELNVFQALYTAMCYADGGTVDDLLVYRLPDHYLLVVNAANTGKDFAWVKEHAYSFDITVENASAQFSQLAVQGPRAEEFLTQITGENLADLKPFWAVQTEWFGQPALVSRTGYTGENGFEVYGPPELGCTLWDKLLNAGVIPIGLGARDSLRFEACLALYGHELERDISPVEAGLGWTVKDKPNDYLGKDVLLSQKQNPPRHLIGLKMLDPGVARQGHAIHQDDLIGIVTSGMKAPTLDGFYALGLVDHAVEVGAILSVDIRGFKKRAQVVKRPFYALRTLPPSSMTTPN